MAGKTTNNWKMQAGEWLLRKYEEQRMVLCFGTLEFTLVWLDECEILHLMLLSKWFFLDNSHNKAFWPVLLFLKATNVTCCRNYGIWVSELAWSAPTQISGDLTICIFCLWNSFNLTGALFSKMKLRSFIDGLRCILCNFWMTDRCPVHWSQ